MAQSNAVAVANGAANIVAVETPRGTLTPDDLDTLRATVFKGATDAQMRLYARACQSRGLDPFSKEIYGWGGRDGAVEIVVGIDGLRNLAESSGEYRGQLGPWFCGEDGQWTDVWLQKQPPLAAKVTVLRRDHEPMTDIALLSEFKKNTPTWNSMPTRMLAKCAEANAIRRMFPRQTSGLYVREELERDDAPPQQQGPNPRVKRLTPEAIADAAARTSGALATGDIVVEDASKPAPSNDTPPQRFPPDDDERGWRQFVWAWKEHLKVSTPDFNTLRRHAQLPLLEKMTVDQAKALYQVMITAFDESTDGGDETDDADSNSDVIDADYQPVMPGMPAQDRWTEG